MLDLTSPPLRTGPNGAAMEAFARVLPEIGIPAHHLTDAFARRRRAVGLLRDGLVAHYVPHDRKPGWDLSDPADLVTEGKVLNHLNAALEPGSVVIPQVVSHHALPGGDLQIRTGIDGMTYEQARRRADFDEQQFGRSLGTAIAALHAVPVEPLQGVLATQEALYPEVGREDIKATRSRMDRSLWKEGASVHAVFNEAGGTPGQPVLLHADLMPRNLRVMEQGSALSGIFDFDVACTGPHTHEFFAITRGYSTSSDSIMSAYHKAGGQQVHPVVVAAERARHIFLQCCRTAGPVPEEFQEELADRLDAYKQTSRRFGPLELVLDR